MHHWPLTFSLIGFISVLSIVVLFFFYRVIKHLASNETIYKEYGDLSDDSTDDDENSATAATVSNNVETVRSRDSDTDSPTSELRRRNQSDGQLIDGKSDIDSNNDTGTE